MTEYLNILDSLKKAKLSKFAFICGCSRYETKSLNNCNDSNKINDLLTLCGFTCTMIKDVNKENFLSEFETFLQSIEEINSSIYQIIIYFSGHGNDGGENGAILKLLEDTEISQEEILSMFAETEEKIRQNVSKGIAEEINKKIYKPLQTYIDNENSKMKNREICFNNEIIHKIRLDIDFQKLFIFDCCRTIDGSQFKTGPKFNTPDTAYLYSTAIGEPSVSFGSDVIDKTSLFTYFLIERLTNDLKRIHNKVIQNQSTCPSTPLNTEFYSSPSDIESDSASSYSSTPNTEKSSKDIYHKKVGRNLYELARVIQLKLANEYIKKSYISKGVKPVVPLTGNQEVDKQFEEIIKATLTNKVSILQGDLTMGGFIICDDDYVKLEELKEFIEKNEKKKKKYIY